MLSFWGDLLIRQATKIQNCLLSNLQISSPQRKASSVVIRWSPTSFLLPILSIFPIWVKLGSTRRKVHQKNNNRIAGNRGLNWSVDFEKKRDWMLLFLQTSPYIWRLFFHIQIWSSTLPSPSSLPSPSPSPLSLLPRSRCRRWMISFRQSITPTYLT